METNKKKIDRWNSLSIKDRALLLQQWQHDNAYPYGVSNSRKRFEKIKSYYVIKAILSENF